VTNKEGQGMQSGANLASYLKNYFGKNQGVRLGETAVISRRVHQRSPRSFPHVKILVEQDAGKELLQMEHPEQVVHVDVYHDPATIALNPLARALWRALDEYLGQRKKSGMLTSEELRDLGSTADLANRVVVGTDEGQGFLGRLVQSGQTADLPLDEDLREHVHLLVHLPETWYDLFWPLISAVEETVLEQGVNLRKLMGITHGFQKGTASREKEVKGLSLPFFGKGPRDNDDVVYKQNMNQVVLAMAERMGGVEEVQNLLNEMSGSVFRRAASQVSKKIKGQIDQLTDQLVDQMTDMGLVEKGLLGPSLTDQGEELRSYLDVNQRELEAELRKLLRRLPAGARNSPRRSRHKTQTKEKDVLNKRKIMARKDSDGNSTIAVPETIIHAARSSLREGRKHLKISDEDVQVYGKRSYVPIDICLLVDCSASMQGDKSQAAWQLAEHLVLSSREKISVVVFQEMEARVAVAFTRNQRRLKQGLRSVHPEGMTPLASGIMKGLELIKESKVKNPLMVLITDGVPTYPLWSFDAQADGLKAAAEIPKHKVHLMCIGLRSNREYLKQLAEEAKGVLYVVDHFTRDAFIEVLVQERGRIINTRE